MYCVSSNICVSGFKVACEWCLTLVGPHCSKTRKYTFTFTLCCITQPHDQNSGLRVCFVFTVPLVPVSQHTDNNEDIGILITCIIIHTFHGRHGWGGVV